MSVAGLDVGTTGCKCSVFDENGKLIAKAYEEYDLEGGGSSTFELDPLKVKAAVFLVLNKVSKQCGNDDIEAIAVSSFGEAGVPVDARGNVLFNSMLYTDVRGAKECEKLVSLLGRQAVMDETGINAHPMYSISKIMWLKENMPDIFKKMHKFLLYEDYIIYLLTGNTVIDHSLASRTMAFDVSALKWSELILDAADIDKDIFSDAVISGTVAGTVTERASEDTSLRAGTKVIAGGHDQVCAAAGAGIFSPGRAVNGMGTVDCITPVFSGPVINREMMDSSFACVPYAIAGLYATYAFNFTGGALLKWFRDNFTCRQHKDMYAWLDRNAGSRPGDILVLPHFAGAATPYMDPDAKGAVVGLTLKTTQGEFYRALMEGVAYEMMYNMERLETAGISIGSLTAVGGGARSDVWLQIKADLFDIPVCTLDLDEAGTCGAALIAAVATGVFPDMKTGHEKMVNTRKYFEPVAQNHDKYMHNYIKYKRMYESVKKITEE